MAPTPNRGTWFINHTTGGGYEITYRRSRDGKVASCGVSNPSTPYSEVEGWLMEQVAPGDAVVLPNGNVLPVQSIGYA